MIVNLLRNRYPKVYYLLKKLKGTNYEFFLNIPPISKYYYSKPILTLEQGNERIKQLIASTAPFFIGRIGSAEMSCLLNYIYLNDKKLNNWHFEVFDKGLFRGNALFPRNAETLEKFAELYMSVIQDMDMLGVWFIYGEHLLHNSLIPKKELCLIETLEPFRFVQPWSKELKNKKVLIIHPYQKSIEKQCQRRRQIFKNDLVLPDFELLTYKPFNTYIDDIPTNITWFNILENMCNEIKKINFDIALIAAGPFGLPLGSRIKGMGKQAIHIGGALQLIFGIRGSRWDERAEFQEYFNEFWMRPLKDETPTDNIKEKIDNSSYW